MAMRLTDGELIDHLWGMWYHGDGGVGSAFVSYIDTGFEPYELLLTCRSLHMDLGGQGDIMRCFFEDWLGEVMQDDPEQVERWTGWRLHPETDMWEGSE